jgi:uncharacterized protein
MPRAEARQDVEKKIRKLRKDVEKLEAQVRRQRRAVKQVVKAADTGKPKEPVLRTPSVAQHPSIEVRQSGVHGKGVFATADIPKGTTLVEYVGEILTWAKAQKRHPHNPDEPNHTFFFHIDDKHVIDAAVGGNDARWINHACDPNCEADEVDGRVFIKTLRKIKSGAELNYDYGLVIEGRLTKKLKAEYLCLCGAKKCRGTMLAARD